ncbi:bifunctional ADP-dependent NAD(P)H-hydrate dehydratase/NAD(P)H-hydrate epimerase [Campylobacter hyointestinalis]|uniref:bifunctional ADP-dependent NAD(P)H-hydrate dehydratase/NAD(P)H-hydrate epimerase n=1 Tax=Campylobacter hyointestinalis TaxID=198 RepID=UPI00072AFC1D|nr:bifunctional ADP-dependent NAD(P)H-hydrate dehydratase/NAD(P)H-hydrate epimerase [Campylobacter hyointestinalis]TWO22402.1 bifunctional ADP-dependent NAD(P)H-hydrate dehydratase/NAD(P)H-hydrate epimerase [Campylobacter hyointestinalis]CUU83437.1 YjeF-related protein [Campylobacter hyointestinalis subsp. hyointestinalis]CUU85351.1 YjeF-related protein [Campylobacter hyointestinalis subsp. hyointestinalis]CUU88346.1 YjeF-related protein [Campylobacter hyointestinalis subsp. hyointestinalis]
MKNLYFSSDEFDKNAILNYFMNELMLQENAALSVANLVRKKLKIGSKILVVCGGGNNSSDAIAAARMLEGDYECKLFFTTSNLNENCKTQLKIAKQIGVKICENLSLDGVHCIIDGIFGSGLNKNLDEKTLQMLNLINNVDALKIAIDFPSGLEKNGRILGACFKADFTVTMGVRKLGLYSDAAKDFVGEIVCSNLGICESKFASADSDFLLELDDLKLPNREVLNTNKGDFGHAFVVCGELSGAAKICAKAALKMGSGRVSFVNLNKQGINLDEEIMQKNSFKGADAIAVGMGLGEAKFDINEILAIPCVVDADMFYKKEILSFLHKDDAILTPHPKEFASLLNIAEFGNFSIEDVQRSRFELAREFSKRFSPVLVLKGANVIIAKNGVLYVSNLGTPSLAVAGSGDALCGILLGFLAQGFSPLDASLNGVLAHQKTALSYKANSYSFTPNDIIKGLQWL